MSKEIAPSGHYSGDTFLCSQKFAYSQEEGIVAAPGNGTKRGRMWEFLVIESFRRALCHFQTGPHAWRESTAHL